MNETQKMAAGGLLGILLIAALIYYFFYKSKPKLNGGQKIDGASQGSKGTPNAQGVQNVYGGGQTYTAAPAGTPNANVVASWGIYSDTMKQIQQVMRDTCAVGKGLTVDGILGPQTLNAIKGYESPYGKQIASEIEATKYITKAQAEWLLKPCGTTTANASASTSGSPATGSVTMNNYMSVDASIIRKFLQDKGFSTNLWYDNAIREWAYAYLMGVDKFYCNECGSKGFYTKAGKWSGSIDTLSKGETYVVRLGATKQTK